MGVMKKWLCGVLCLVLLLGLLPTAALAEGTELPASGGELSAGTYTLSTDVTLTADITISEEVTIDLAGHTLAGTGQGSVITVTNSGKLTLEDSGNNPEQPGKITGGVISAENPDGYKLGGGVTVSEGGTFVMNDGDIVGNTGYGVNVAAFNGTAVFTMNGGAIADNTGGGLNVTGSGATATINQTAVIANNKTIPTGSGGGVHVIGGGTVTLNGGKIQGNEASVDGGGVYVGDKGIFILRSGEIQDNKANNTGGGVYINGAGTFTMEGTEETSKILRNVAGSYGGGVVVSEDSIFGMSGGAIVENTATQYAGGIYQHGTFTVSGTSVAIDNNTLNGTECNVYLKDGMTITNSSLTDGNIGITTEMEPTAENPVTVLTGAASVPSWLKSDSADYELAVGEGNTVVLKTKTADPGPGLDEGDITRAELAEKIQQHTPFGLSGETSGAYTVFTDLNGCTDSQKNAIGVLYERQYMGGTSAGKFNPTGGVTRAQAAAVIWRAMGSPSYTENVTVPYVDVDTSQWYSAAIHCLYAMGVLDETDRDGSGNLRINDYATRDDIEKWLNKYPAQGGGTGGNVETVPGGSSRVDYVVSIYNVLSQSDREKGDEEEEVPFVDIASCTPEQQKAITYFYSIEVIKGTTETTFEPYAAVSNAQIATFLSRLAGALGDVPATTEAVPAAAMLRASDDNWYADAVSFLVEEGVLTAEEAEDNAFIPHAPSLTTDIADWSQGLKPAAPVFSTSGGTYFSTQLVTLTAAEGLTIYYTTDGSVPTRASAVYQSPIPISTTTTVKAIAAGTGLTSNVVSASYTIVIDSGSGGSDSDDDIPDTTGNVSGSGDDVSVSVGSNSVSASQMERAVKKADVGSAITIKAAGASTISLPAGGLADAAANNNDVVVDLRNGEMTLSSQAISGLIDGISASGKVEAAITSQTSSGDEAISELLDKGAVVFDVSVKVGGESVHSFDGSLTITFTVPNLSRITDPHILHILTDGTREYYTPDRVSGSSITIKGIRNLSTFAVIPGSEVPEVPKEPTNPFTDVYESDYYYDAVLWAVETGVTNGTSAVIFAPDVTVTRAQMVTFLWRAYGAPRATCTNPFTDVHESDYYYDAVLWAVANGITNGTSATTFNPDLDVTRAQAVTFQWRATGAPAVSGGGFGDVVSDTYYVDAVAWAVATGITNGTGSNTFSPDLVVSRAQAVTFLYRELA